MSKYTCVAGRGKTWMLSAVPPAKGDCLLVGSVSLQIPGVFSCEHELLKIIMVGSSVDLLYNLEAQTYTELLQIKKKPSRTAKKSM